MEMRIMDDISRRHPSSSAPPLPQQPPPSEVSAPPPPHLRGSTDEDLPPLASSATGDSNSSSQYQHHHYQEGPPFEQRYHHHHHRTASGGDIVNTMRHGSASSGDRYSGEPTSHSHPPPLPHPDDADPPTRWSNYEPSSKAPQQNYRPPSPPPSNQKRPYQDHHYSSRDGPPQGASSTPKRPRSQQWQPETREGYEQEAAPYRDEYQRRDIPREYSRDREWTDDRYYDSRDQRYEPRLEQRGSDPSRLDSLSRSDSRAEPRMDPRMDGRPAEARIEASSSRMGEGRSDQAPPNPRASEPRMNDLPPAPPGYSSSRRRSGSDVYYNNAAPRDVSRSFSDDRSNSLERERERALDRERDINRDRNQAYDRGLQPPPSPTQNGDSRAYPSGRGSNPPLSPRAAPSNYAPRYSDPLPPRGGGGGRYADPPFAGGYQGRDDYDSMGRMSNRGGVPRDPRDGRERDFMYEHRPSPVVSYAERERDRERDYRDREPTSYQYHYPRETSYYPIAHPGAHGRPPSPWAPPMGPGELMEYRPSGGYSRPPPLQLRSPRQSPSDLREASSSSTHGTYGRGGDYISSSRSSVPSHVLNHGPPPPHSSSHHYHSHHGPPPLASYHHHAPPPPLHSNPRSAPLPEHSSYAGRHHSNDPTVLSRKEGRLLLAQKEDRMSLSEALCIIRENVEVFKATQRDVDAPAPGRKNAVLVGQVGLRCIHCLNFTEKVKRAVCYPSSIRRIYRTITDMKLDHFSACPGVPRDVKERLDELKIVSSRSTGTTMRYFVESAAKMGMQDAENGVRFKEGYGDKIPTGKDDKAPRPPVKKEEPDEQRDPDDTMPPLPSLDSANRTLSNNNNGGTGGGGGGGGGATAGVQERQNSLQSDSTPTHRNSGTKMESLLSTSAMLLGKSEAKTINKAIEGAVSHANSKKDEEADKDLQTALSKDSSKGAVASIVSCTSNENNDQQGNTSTIYHGKVLLSQPEDKFMLSPLRCFLREHVYVFSATEADIAARTPTNFSVVLGQVGICCRYCFNREPKERINRAVCFPFSIDRIYQSVADMQRFHFNVCQEVPQDVRYQFESLKSASSKGSKGLATRQYWVTSGKKMGLIDTPTGIKFSRDPASAVGNANVSLDILAQVAVDMTKRRPLVLEEDRALIADFLYVVMQQVQRCTFSEMDKNKRRNKEVGCVGVECRHCVGQPTSRKFFWASVNAVESNFISVHTHLMECTFVPKEIADELSRLKELRKEQTAKLKSGSQKAFFARVWKRLHEDLEDDETSQESGDEGEFERPLSPINRPPQEQISLAAMMEAAQAPIAKGAASDVASPVSPEVCAQKKDLTSNDVDMSETAMPKLPAFPTSDKATAESKEIQKNENQESLPSDTDSQQKETLSDPEQAIEKSLMERQNDAEMMDVVPDGNKEKTASSSSEEAAYEHAQNPEHEAKDISAVENLNNESPAITNRRDTNVVATPEGAPECVTNAATDDATSSPTNTDEPMITEKDAEPSEAPADKASDGDEDKAMEDDVTRVYSKEVLPKEKVDVVDEDSMMTPTKTVSTSEESPYPMVEV